MEFQNLNEGELIWTRGHCDPSNSRRAPIKMVDVFGALFLTIEQFEAAKGLIAIQSDGMLRMETQIVYPVSQEVDH